MIKIQKAVVTALNTIDIKVETIPEETIQRVLVYKLDDYKDPTKAVDVSYLLRKENNFEDISIPATEFAQNKIEGFFIIEIKSTETNIENNCDIVYNEGIAIVSNNIKYDTCLIERALRINTEGCNEKTVVDDCVDCTEDNIAEACMASTLYAALKGAVQHGFFEEAKRIKKELDCICKPCKGCPDYVDSKFFNGTGFGTFDNNVILV